MPYSVDKPDPKTVEKIRDRHPRATASDIRQWIHVFNESYGSALEDGKSKDEAEGIAFRNAWGVLKKRFKKKSVSAYDLDFNVPELVFAGLRDHFSQADEHQLAAAGTSGRTVVAAGAGSGKTTMMVAKIRHAIRELKIPPSQFLVCSFGGKSAEDMKAKIAKAVGEKAASQMQIATIHGMCRRELIAMNVPEGKLLGSRSHTPLFGGTQTIYIKNFIAALEAEIGQRFPADALSAGDVAMQIGKWKGDGKHPADVVTKIEINEMVDIVTEEDEDGNPYLIVTVTDKKALIAFIYELYECGKFPKSQRMPDWMRTKSSDEVWIKHFKSYASKKKLESAFKFVDGPRMDFYDMQTAMLWHLNNNPRMLANIQGKYSQIYVDECQDTSPLQFGVVLKLGSHVAKDDPKRTLWMVGDDKQSIYFFRGTRPKQFIELAEDPDWKLRKMPNNYRSTASIVAMANSLIGNNTGQIDMPAIASGPNKDMAGDVELHRPETRQDCTLRTIEKIREKKDVDPLASFEDFAVICRTNNELGDYELMMLLEGIPYVRKGGQNFLASFETKALLNYMKIASRETNPRDLHAAIFENLRTPDRDMLSSRNFRETFDRGNGGYHDLVQCAQGGGSVGKTKWRFDSFERRAETSCASYLDQIEKIRAAGKTMSTTELFNYILDNVVGWDKDEGEGRTLREHIHSKLSEREDEGSEESGEDSEGPILQIGNASVLFTITEYKKSTSYNPDTLSGFLGRIKEIEQMVEANSAKTTKIVRDPYTGRNKRVKAEAPDAVTLCTAHASKGLEWDYTFNQMPLYTFPLMGIVLSAEDAADGLASLSEEDKRFPNPELLQKINEWTDALEEYEAERRLAYVAMTRAKKHIYVMSPATTKSGKDCGPSPFIFEAEVEEHATFSEMTSIFDYDSLEEAAQHMQSGGRDKEAMLLNTLIALRGAGKTDEAKLLLTQNKDIWPIVLNTRGTRDIQSTVFKLNSWWPMPQDVKKFIPMVGEMFPDGGRPEQATPSAAQTGSKSHEVMWTPVGVESVSGNQVKLRPVSGTLHYSRQMRAKRFGGRFDPEAGFWIFPTDQKAQQFAENIRDAEGTRDEEAEDIAQAALDDRTAESKQASYKDLLPGGLADDKKPSDFNKKQLAKGTKVEMEHTSNKALAREIAMDHLTEDPQYYVKLHKMEHGKQAGYLDEFADEFSDFDDFGDVDPDEMPPLLRTGPFGLVVKDIQHWVSEIHRRKLFDVDPTTSDRGMVEGPHYLEPSVGKNEVAHQFPVFKYTGSFDTDGISSQIVDLFQASGQTFPSTVEPNFFICEHDVVVAASLARISSKRYKVWVTCTPNRLEHIPRIIKSITDHHIKLCAITKTQRLEIVAEHPSVRRHLNNLGFLPLYDNVYGPTAYDEKPKDCDDCLVDDSYLDDSVELGGVEILITRDEGDHNDQFADSSYYVLESEEQVEFEDIRDDLADLLGVDIDQIQYGTDHNEFVLRIAG